MTNDCRIVAFNHFPVIPARVGGAIRVFELMRNLAKNGYSIKIYAYGDPSHSYVSGMELRTISKPFSFLTEAGGLLGGSEGKIATDVLLDLQPKLALAAEHDIERADIVQTEHLWSSLFPLISARRKGIRSVFDDHNAEFVLAERSYGELNSRAKYLQPLWKEVVKTLERTCCELADVVIVTSEADRRVLSKTFEISRDKFHVVANGVNTDEIYASETARSQIRKSYGLRESDQVLLFIGKYDYPPNMYCAKYIVRKLAPVIFARHQDARILMVGRCPPAHLSNDARIIWTGEVENVMPYINACDVALAPIPIGSGTRLKVLSYLACDRPVVATPAAIEGLQLKEGKHILKRSLRSFPEAILGLLEDRTAAAEFGAGASTFIKSNYDWKIAASKLAEIHRRIT